MFPLFDYVYTIFVPILPVPYIPSDAVNVSLSPMEDPVTYLFRAPASANNTIMLTCSWDAEVYYVAWLRNGVSFYGEDLVRGVERQEYGSFTGSPSVTVDFAARWSTLQVTDAFITDSANYTCAVTCGARQVVRGEVQQVSEGFSATREVLVLGEWGIYSTYFSCNDLFQMQLFLHSFSCS